MRVFVVSMLVLGLVVETALRLTVFLVVACTFVGMAFLCWEDNAELLVRPALGPFLTKVLESS